MSEARLARISESRKLQHFASTTSAKARLLVAMMLISISTLHSIVYSDYSSLHLFHSSSLLLGLHCSVFLNELDVWRLLHRGHSIGGKINTAEHQLPKSRTQICM